MTIRHDAHHRQDSAGKGVSHQIGGEKSSLLPWLSLGHTGLERGRGASAPLLCLNAQRLLDCACGCMEAIDGHTDRFAAKTFLVTSARGRAIGSLNPD